MRLHLLGTAGYHPNEFRDTPCLMLPECGVLLDAGTGMHRLRALLQTRTLDIFLTHAHLDHVVGLTYLTGLLYDRPMDRVCVHGEPEKLQAVDEHLFSPLLFPVRPRFTWCPLAGPVTLPDGGVVRWFPLRHPGGAVGYRIDWPDRSLAYVTDATAGPDASYLDEIRNVDVLVHECFFPDGWEERAEFTGHSCLTPVAHVARQSGARRLVLVHINPLAHVPDPFGVDSVREIFAETLIGQDGLVVEF
jgi:ribonuclease Z